MPNLYLVGLPGAGKTTVGRILSRRLEWRFVDLDRLITQREHASIQELYARGEDYFADRETEALVWVRDHCDRCVIATGGGIVEREANVSLLEGETVLYVARHPRSILQTLKTDRRPSFRDEPERIYQFARRRIPVYEKIADFRVTNNRSLRSCIGRVLAELEQRGFARESARNTSGETTMKHPLADKKLYLLDMDGTIYLENDLIDGALDFIYWLRDTGRDYVFLTNNSSKSADAYLEKLARLKIPADRSNMFTSGQAACIFLNNLKPGAKIYCVGTRSLKEELRGAGFTVAEGVEDGVDFLLVGYDTELTYQKLTDACELLTRGVPFYATNPDWVCPAQKGKYLPDCHTMCDMLERATGVAPFYIGKPRKEMALAAIQFKGGDPATTALVGDRLYTDIQCGLNAGITSVFVLSGEGTRADMEKYGVHPDVILNSVKDIIGCDR